MENQIQQKQNIPFKVSTWNVEGKGTPEEIDKILSSSIKQLPHVVCIQEANLPASGETENYKWLCSGAFGSAVLVSKGDSISGTFEQVSEQICTSELVIVEKYKLKVISCYIPPSTNYITLDVWSKLTEILKTVPCTQCFVLAGDFNAQIGSKDSTRIAGDLGLVSQMMYHDVSNENGIELKKLLIKAHLRIISSLGKKRKDSYTYKNGEEKIQRDYIIASRAREYITLETTNWFHDDYKHAVITKGFKISPSSRWRAFNPGMQNGKEQQSESKLIVSTWNVQGTSPLAIVKILNDLDIPVMCVQDVFLTSDDDVKTDNFTWFTSKKLWSKNVGILIKTCPDITMDNFKVVSEYMCVGEVTFFGNKLTVVSCHIPHHTDSKFEAVSGELVELVKSIPKSEMYVVAGDFNTQTIHLVNDVLEYEQDDKNASFLKNLFSQVEFDTKFLTFSKYSVTHVSDTKRRNPHQVLSSLSCTQKYQPRRDVRWIPFFENALVYLLMNKISEVADQQNLTKKAPKEAPEKAFCHVERINGFIHSSRIHSPEEGERLKKVLEVTDLPPEEVEKYKNTPPPVEDLYRILGDFTLYYGVDHESLVSKRINGAVLARSFEALNRGELVAENVEVHEEITNTPVKKFIRFRWNGIVVFEESSKDKGFRALKVRAQSLFVGLLGEKFYAVKAKKSYFNQGFPPMCKDNDKLDEVRSVVNKKDFPKTEDVTNFIDDFFRDDSDLELVFGPDFTSDDLNVIKRHAESKNYGFRWYKSSANLKTWDHLTVFIKRSPQYLRDILLKKPDFQDLRYYLVPPSGIGCNYVNKTLEWEKEHLVEENKLKSENSFRNSNRTKDNAVLPQGVSAKTSNPTRAERRRFAMSEAHKPTASRKFRHLLRESSGRNGTTDDGQYRWEQYSHPKPSRPAERRYSKLHDVPQPAAESRYSRFHDVPQPTAGQKRSFQQRELDQQYRPDSYGSKKPRNTSRADRIHWDDFAPLIMVWPINIRSEPEESPRKVIEANFPTEIVMEDNSVAVYVTLPLRNRREKKFCLTVGHQMHVTLRHALDLLVKRSSVIKHTPSFLPPNGSAPNFVRYKVPCQTNPRTYIILSRNETGSLTSENIREIFNTFKSSFNEDVFFDNLSYSHNEKTMLIELAPKFDLKVRHFGDDNRLVNRYVCVYKTKPKDVILEEVLRMRDFHPKYLLATNKLPPRLGLNIF